MENSEAKETEKSMKYALLCFEAKRQIPGDDVIKHNVIVDVPGGVALNGTTATAEINAEKCGIAHSQHSQSFKVLV